jgi:paraquat-inducible protein A
VAPLGTRACPRCGTALHSRMPASIQRVLAWLLVGFMCYVPANVLPMLKTRTLGRETDSTILGGVVELAHHGAWDIAGVVFVASVVIPVSKFVVILYLVFSIRNRVRLGVHARIHLYEIVEFIGRWSMIDVFVVAILTALVQFSFLASINPGSAAVFFALSVAFTMLSAQAFDPRLIWDSAEPETRLHA